MSASHPESIRWIGDIHGDPWFGTYAGLIATALPTRQIGDLGLGFGTPPRLAAKDRFIRGNHDDPALCRAHPNWISDGTIADGIFYVGGAASSDRARRVEGQGWWRDEELDLADWDRVIAAYAAARPRVVASHDAPESVRAQLFPVPWDLAPSRTRQALDALLALHAPQTWIFGHWHAHRDAVIGGVRYIALATHQALDLAL